MGSIYPWYAKASDQEIDAHPSAPSIRSNLGEHVTPDGHHYRLVDHGIGRVVSAHYTGKTGQAQPRSAGYLTWFGGRATPDDTTIKGRIAHVGVSEAHRCRGVASAMLDFARAQHPEDDIAHSTNLSDDAVAWSQKKASTPMNDSIVIAGKVMHYTGYDTAASTQGWLSEQRTSYIVDGRIYSANAPMSFEAMFRKHAHDSGDGETIYHCPFCGSGQVIARSDKTIECEFCHTAFTVQVQPTYSAFPQTINGVPVQVPGMPGQIGGDPMAGGMPPGADPAADPNADPDADGAPPFGDDGGDADQDGSDDSDSDSDDKGGNPFAKGSSLDPYVARLALSFSDDREATLAAVRARSGR